MYRAKHQIIRINSSSSCFQIQRNYRIDYRTKRLKSSTAAQTLNFPIDQRREKPSEKRKDWKGSTNRTRSILCPPDRPIVRWWHERETSKEERTETLLCTCSQVYVRTFHPRVQCIFLPSPFILSFHSVPFLPSFVPVFSSRYSFRNIATMLILS